ncbi:MAG: PBP1A family penicillin-binding protein [Holosporaceae bacterium]|jgi:penicillin-binding protein 1A|nr:PBP1A family penicillin-binding protein [Holosporaceae bacterium]
MKILRWIGYALCLLIVIAGIGVATLFLVLYMLSSELPDHNSLRKYSPDVASRVFLQDGSKLCEYATEKRYFIPIDRIPKRLINAFVSAEDKHFFEHAGVDFFRIMRSAIKNLENIGTGKRPQGASTITQQVARLFLIKNNEVSYLRKVKEAILSFRIESVLSKQQILELYLNQIYLGMGSYGVAAAAKIYFDKTADELTLSECSYLASLAKGANNYHPLRHRKAAIARRNWAIQRQLEDGFITSKEANQALEEEFKVVQQDTPEETAEYFSEEIRKYLIEKFSFESLNKEGLIVRATLDTRLQACAYDALRSGLEKVDRSFGWRGAISKTSVDKSSGEIVEELRKIELPRGSEGFLRAVVVSIKDKNVTILTENGELGKISETDRKWAQKIKIGDVVLVSESSNRNGDFLLKQVPIPQGAIIVMEANTGRILAMQGGYSFKQSEFNRATQAMRQIGSTFKSFVYLAGLENGFAPNTIIDASPVEVDLGGKLGVWKPRNYHGRVLDKITFRQAIEKSINTATIRIAQEVGLDKIARIAEKFGIFDSMPELISYALGAGETTLLRLTTAYAMLANGGKRISPTMIDYIQDKRGNTIFRADERPFDSSMGLADELPPKLNDNRQQILSEQSVYQITSLLEGVMRRGSGAGASFLNFPIAGKTGTSNESRDVWFIGYTPDIVVGVFVGFDDHSKSLGKEANGANTALPIFIDFMVKAQKYLSPKPFRVPRGIKLRKIDAETGGAPSTKERNVILEAFKEDEDFEQQNLIREKRSISNLLDEENSESTDRIKPIPGIY